MPSEIGCMNFKNAHKKEKVKTTEFYETFFFFFFLSTSQTLCFLEKTKLSTLSSALNFILFYF